MHKHKALYSSLLFIIYFVIGLIILFSEDLTALFKIALFLTLTFLAHYFKGVIKKKSIK